MPAQALEDLRVLDLSQYIAGGYCTKLLADFGAQVIKVETPGTGDSTRRAGPFPNDLPHPEQSGLFLYLNGGKRSITLDIGTGTGAHIMKELVSHADVVVESFPPGSLESLGLGYPTLREINPGLVVASLTYFGQVGPYRDYLGSDLVAYAVGGYAYLTGDPDREPLRSGGSLAEYLTGTFGALAIMAALAWRDQTAEGQHLDVSSIEAVAATFDGVTLFTMLERMGHLPRRRGTRLINPDPHSPYPSTLLPCQDGWVHAHWSPSNPEGLAFLAGNPRLADEEIMAEMMGHADEIDTLLTQWLKNHSRDEVVERAQEVRAPFTKVQSVAETFQDPQNEARGYFTPVEHPVAGTLKYPGSPIHMSRTPWQPGRAPLLGEHNREVFGEMLGYSKGELVTLREAGVI